MRTTVVQCVFGLVLASVGCSLCFSADNTADGKQKTVAVSVLGEWKEHWGTPGETDVTYSDQYKISPADDSKVKVAILNRKQVIENEHLEGSTLTFTQHTDMYIVKYSLTLQPDNKWMIGTATTPDKVVKVKWERTNASVLGEWKEHWGTPGETDVTYNDQYRVSRADDSKIKVTILDRTQVIEDAHLEGNTLTFTQHTTFAVKYSLTLQPDNKWMIGTATTPEKVVKVKWERTK